MKQNTDPTPLFSRIFPIMTTVILVLAGCTGNGINDTAGHEKTHSGTVKVSVHLGRIGTLAKRSAIEMEHLIIQIRQKETDSVVAADTSGISGNEETIVDKTFPGFSAPDTFTLSVKSVDTNGKVIHQGSKSFNTSPGDTTDVSLDLDAQYSMLRVSFNDIPDSVDNVVLMIDDVDTIDSSFTSGSRESIVFEYDYLEADEDGIEYDLSLRAGGSFYGNDTVLYAADTTIVAQSGADTGFQVVLKWVGPDIPHGAAEFTVTIGTVGTTLINAEFETMAGGVPTAGLVAYYPFNGNADDESGNGNDGTADGGVSLTSDRFGRESMAYSFDGVDGFIKASADDLPTGERTVSLWFNTEFVSARPVFLGYGGSQCGESWFMAYYDVCYMSSHCDVNTIYPEDSMDLSGSWHHFVVTTEPSGTRIYIDGTSVAENTVFVENTVVEGTDLSLGVDVDRYGFAPYTDENVYYLDGDLDDIRIYNCALSESEISALYHENGWTGN